MSPFVRIVTEEIARCGGSIDAVLLDGRRHDRLKWRVGDRLFVSTVPRSPSDWRAMKNARAQIRRKARAA